MKPRCSAPPRLIRSVASIVTILAALYGPSEFLRADQPKPAVKVQPAPKKLSGAELYDIYCNRCHAARKPAEFDSAQWQTILIHMRVRASVPAKPAREILKYLQAEAGN